MSKKQFFIGSIILAVSLISIPAFATDYSSLETSELANLRGTMRDASTEDRDAFRAEWQNRISRMSSEEAQAYRGRPENAIADGNGDKDNANNSRKNRRKIRSSSQLCGGTGNKIGNRGSGRGGNGNRRQ